MKGHFAGVCVFENPFCSDTVYDYMIPYDFEATVHPGVLVTVPFGMSNQIRMGLVREVREESEYRNHKMIRSVCPEDLALDTEMLGLCEFLKSRTLCTTGDAVRTMLPAAALSRLADYYSVNPERVFRESDDRRFSDLIYRQLYDYIAENGEVELPRLRAHFDIRIETITRRLASMGYLLHRTVFRQAKEGKSERLWQLAIPEDRAERLMNGDELDGIKLTSAKHKSILAVLLDAAAPMTGADLCEQSSSTQTQLKAMTEKGLIESFEYTVGRNPYRDAAPYVGRTPLSLNDEQEKAFRTLAELSDSDTAKAALLWGVTGSGKTCVMTAFIDRLLDRGKGVILLLPEIALTPQSVAIFCSRYGDRVAVIHSALSTRERYDTYCRVSRGDADVVIGTRSAVFAPVKNLGAVIIDEEQEHTYKSDRSPRYHARDVARYRCKCHNALMLLASATPSVESFKKAMDGTYTLLRLSHRYGNARLPDTEIVDMRKELLSGNQSILSRRLTDCVADALSRGEQSILFLNRRGYHNSLGCRSCGKPILCPGCSVAMTYHTKRHTFREGELICHWCGRKFDPPAVCPECGSDKLAFTGSGTQRVEEELKLHFPEARILRMDADTATSKQSYESLLGRFRSGDADILLGTQMVTKGHDFPKVTVVGILSADAALYLDDYRAAERTFAMLTQVIGRAGRADLPGHAIIQTENPDHEIITLACRQDFGTFYEREIRLRRGLCFPPICDIAVFSFSSHLEQFLLLGAKKLVQELDLLLKEDFPDVQVVPFGPFEEPVYRVDNRYRMRMVFKCRLTGPTFAMFATLLSRFSAGCGKQVRSSVDFNPTNL